MSVECKYAVLVTAVGADGLEYSFPLYSNLEKRAQILSQAIHLSICTGSTIAVDGVPLHLVRASGPFTL